MAIIRPLHGEMSGSIGGNTYSRNRGGPYVRLRTTPVNPNTAAQQQARARLTIVSRAWSDLTAAERELWRLWAIDHPVYNSLGQQITLTGEQAFCQLNTRALVLGTTVNNTPPSVLAPDALATFSAAWSEATNIITCTYTGSPLAANTHIALWGAQVTSPGVRVNRAQARLLATSAVAAPSPAALTSRIAGQAGWTAHLWAEVWHDVGLVAPGLYAAVTIAA